MDRMRPARFQSTHPLRGATYPPFALRAEGSISIHAPLAGCDVCGVCNPPKSINFNPRTPCGVRPLSKRIFDDSIKISIHAPLAGCDHHGLQGAAIAQHFNPRTPCGVRRAFPLLQFLNCRFQSTHPLRGATVSRGRCEVTATFQSTHPLRGATFFLPHHHIALAISIHAPLAGCDFYALCKTFHRRYFNPRTPCGVRPHPTYCRCKTY